MASRSLGSLTLDLVARIGGFTRGLDAAERKADQTARAIARKQAQRAKEMEKLWSNIGVAIGASITAAVAGITSAVVAIDQLAKGAATFKDLEETTGASAEGLASFAVAAGTAGVSMDTIAANSIRLTKALVGVDDESKAAGAAIKALGLDLDAFKKLDPVAQTDALTAAFAGFADGAEKTAVATALWGKSGAEMLKVMKALQEQGGRTVILTQQQIELADQYADKQAKATEELKLYAQAAATQAIPAFLAITEEAKKLVAEIIGLDKETGKLAANSAVKEFAQAGAIAIADLLDWIRTFAAEMVSMAATTKAEAKGIQLAFATIRASPQELGDFFLRSKGPLQDLANEYKKLSADAKAAAEAIKTASAAATSGENLRRRFDLGLTGERMTAFNDPRSTLFGSPERDLLVKPKIDFTGAVKGDKEAKKKIDDVTKAVQDLEKELALFGQDEAFKKAFEFEGMGATTAQIEAYRANLAKLEELRTAAAIQETIDALVKERDEVGLTNEQLTIHRLILQGASADQIKYAQGVLQATKAAKDQKEQQDEIKKIYEETRTPAEKLAAEIDHINKVLNFGKDNWDLYSRAIFAAQDRFDEATKKNAETVDSFAKKFAENAQDLLGQGLYDAMTGNFKNIGDAFAQMITRMVAEAAAAELSRHLFGDLLKGGQGQGIFGSILSGIGSLFGGARADGGPVEAGRAYVVGEHRPEVFVPRTAGTILPSTQGMGGNNTFNISVNSNGYMDRSAEERSAARIARSVSERQKRRSA